MAESIRILQPPTASPPLRPPKPPWILSSHLKPTPQRSIPFAAGVQHRKLCFISSRLVRFRLLTASSIDEASIQELESAPVEVELLPICSEDQFHRIIKDAQTGAGTCNRCVELYLDNFENISRLELSSRLDNLNQMASWCRKCIYLKPKLEKLAAEYHPRLRFLCVDINKVSHKLVAHAGITENCQWNFMVFIEKAGVTVPRMPVIQLWKDGLKQAEVIGGHKAHLVVNERQGGDNNGGLDDDWRSEMANGSDTNLSSDKNPVSSIVDAGVEEQHACGSLERSWARNIESLLEEQRGNQGTDSGRGLSMYRSGSAPPTVQASVNAIESVNSRFGFIEDGNRSSRFLFNDEMRLHPAYLSHNGSDPRYQPAFLSEEELAMQQRYRGGGLSGVDDLRKRAFLDGMDSSPLMLPQPRALAHGREYDFLNHGVAIPINSVDALQVCGGVFNFGGFLSRCFCFCTLSSVEGLDQSNSLPGPVSHPSSRSAFADNVDRSGNFDICSSSLSNVLESKEDFPSGVEAGLARNKNQNSTALHGFPVAANPSLSRSRTLEVPLVGRSWSPRLSAANRGSGEMNSISESYAISDCSTGMTDPSELSSYLSHVCLLENGFDGRGDIQSEPQEGLTGRAGFLSDGPIAVDQVLVNGGMAQEPVIPTHYSDFLRRDKILKDHNISQSCFDDCINFFRRTASADRYSKSNLLGNEGLGGPCPFYRGAKFHAAAGHIRAGYSSNQKLNSEIGGYFYPDGQSYNRGGNNILLEHHLATMNSLRGQYLHRSCDSPAIQNFYSHNKYANISHLKLLRSREAHLEALLALEKQYIGEPLAGKSHDFIHGYCDSVIGDVGVNYRQASVTNALRGARRNDLFRRDDSMHFTPRNSTRGSAETCHFYAGLDSEHSLAFSLLEEFKSNNMMSLELPNIVGHVLDFSTDQCGSRFIQQKLETATDEERIMIFSEIIPHAYSLMTDVFGNYVIQRLFELGTQSQRKDLVSQLIGHVLPLSLQMYGCRVVQKALEVVDVEEKTRMVMELDGSVLQCVRDQNGNHVIQKCIDCIPQDKIQFIISAFFGQVFSLSVHPYGCRVVQRVLENCHDLNTQTKIMDEIMQFVCTLAEDQYGNYVIQHVIQYGSPQERFTIITKLAGQIVKMSQQKYASNVIEKCLTFGSPEERQILVKEMLGSMNENEPLQDMMKDPFGNYVVQKVLETCDNQTRELILSRIMLHLNTLKKYTYGKRIVSRVEKLLI
ncbi:Pumilio homolog 4-like protein [Drosera capensis]